MYIILGMRLAGRRTSQHPCLYLKPLNPNPHLLDSALGVRVALSTSNSIAPGAQPCQGLGLGLGLGIGLLGTGSISLRVMVRVMVRVRVRIRVRVRVRIGVSSRGHRGQVIRLPRLQNLPYPQSQAGVMYMVTDRGRVHYHRQDLAHGHWVVTCTCGLMTPVIIAPVYIPPFLVYPIYPGPINITPTQYNKHSSPLPYPYLPLPSGTYWLRMEGTPARTWRS